MNFEKIKNDKLKISIYWRNFINFEMNFHPKTTENNFNNSIENNLKTKVIK